MKMKFILISNIMTLIVLSSCVKTETKPLNNTNTNTNSSPSTNPPIPTIYYDGVISVQKNKIYSTVNYGSGPVTTTLFNEMASAAFKSSNNIIDVGNVKINDSLFKKYSNNVYVFQKYNSNSTTGFTGFLSSSFSIKYDGNSSHGFSSYVGGFSAVPDPVWTWTTSSNTTPTVSLSSGFVFKNLSNSSYDSVMIQIVGGGGKVFQKMLPNYTSSYTVTPSELSGMQPTASNTLSPSGQVNYYGMKYINLIVGTKTITLVKVSSTTYLGYVVN